MKLENVAVLGVGMTRFGAHPSRSNVDLACGPGSPRCTTRASAEGRWRVFRRLPRCPAQWASAR
jgi:hypothetical protein